MIIKGMRYGGIKIRSPPAFSSHSCLRTRKIFSDNAESVGRDIFRHFVVHDMKV